MVDPKLIRDTPALVKRAVKRKGGDPVIVDEFLNADTQRRTLQQALQELQTSLNTSSKQLATATPEERDIMRHQLRSLSDSIQEQGSQLNDLETLCKQLHRQIPNIPSDDVPDGASDKENVVVRTEGVKPEFTFPPKDHEQLCAELDLLDMERAAKVAGAKFYYLKNELSLLEQAVMRFATDTLYSKGFTMLSVPNLVKAEVLYGSGLFVTPEDATDGDAYRIDRDDLYLVGTAEPPLVAFHSGEVLHESELPLRYAALSPAFRREAGTYGKETRGLYRVHQFNKVEMVSLTRPEDSQKEQELLLGIAEELLHKLGLHYQVVLNCAGDLGHPQVKKWDIETWLPGMNKYGETHSCSNDTDYQARSLNIRFKASGKDGEKDVQYVHTLNNTALSSARILIAILENYQQPDGSIEIPKALHAYIPFTRITRR